MTATFSVPRGADDEYILTFEDGGSPQSIDGCKIWATVKTAANAQGGGAAAFRRRNTLAGGGDTEIEHLTQSGETLGKFKLKFVPSNTSSLTPGTGYVIDVFLETAGGKRYQIVAAQVFEVALAVTTDFT